VLDTPASAIAAAGCIAPAHNTSNAARISKAGRRSRIA
jgi:hypothetical protein